MASYNNTLKYFCILFCYGIWNMFNIIAVFAPSWVICSWDIVDFFEDATVDIGLVTSCTITIKRDDYTYKFQSTYQCSEYSSDSLNDIFKPKNLRRTMPHWLGACKGLMYTATFITLILPIVLFILSKIFANPKEKIYIILIISQMIAILLSVTALIVVFFSLKNWPDSDEGKDVQCGVGWPGFLLSIWNGLIFVAVCCCFPCMLFCHDEDSSVGSRVSNAISVIIIKIS